MSTLYYEGKFLRVYMMPFTRKQYKGKLPLCMPYKNISSVADSGRLICVIDLTGKNNIKGRTLSERMYSLLKRGVKKDIWFVVCTGNVKNDVYIPQ